MSKFFINRPIVAIVISIVLVLVGSLTILNLPVAQFPNIAPPEIQILGYVRWSRCSDIGTGRCHSARATDERRGQHELHVLPECHGKLQHKLDRQL